MSEYRYEPQKENQASATQPPPTNAPNGGNTYVGMSVDPTTAAPNAAPSQQHYYYSPPPPPSGQMSWLLGLAVMIPLPIIGSVFASLAMIFAGLSLRKNPDVGGYNALKAADWGMTYLLGTILLLGAHFWILFAVLPPEGTSEFFPTGIPITIWAVLTVFHLGYCIYGGLRANQRLPIRFSGIPFFSWRRNRDF